MINIEMEDSLESASSKDLISFLSQELVSMTNEQASELLYEYYDIKGDCTCLSSEKDLNFYVSSSDGIQFILKISHPAESYLITNFQTEALLHIHNKEPYLPVPKLYISKNGVYEEIIEIIPGKKQVMRLLSFMEGESLARVRLTESLLDNFGSCLAKLNNALADFEHPIAKQHKLLWDLKHASSLKKILKYIDESEKYKVLEKVLNDFELFVEPSISSLTFQVIHNDLNPQNILVDSHTKSEISGIFDFGDMVYTPAIVEVAVASAYILSDSNDSLSNVIKFLKAYSLKKKISTLELELLYDLISTRLAMIILISNWRAKLYPDNSEYLLRNHENSWNRLKALLSIQREDGIQRFKESIT